jgi:hypothetical protein
MKSRAYEFNMFTMNGRCKTAHYKPDISGCYEQSNTLFELQ